MGGSRVGAAASSCVRTSSSSPSATRRLSTKVRARLKWTDAETEDAGELSCDAHPRRTHEGDADDSSSRPQQGLVTRPRPLPRARLPRDPQPRCAPHHPSCRRRRSRSCEPRRAVLRPSQASSRWAAIDRGPRTRSARVCSRWQASSPTHGPYPSWLPRRRCVKSRPSAVASPTWSSSSTQSKR